MYFNKLKTVRKMPKTCRNLHVYMGVVLDPIISFTVTDQVTMAITYFVYACISYVNFTLHKKVKVFRLYNSDAHVFASILRGWHTFNTSCPFEWTPRYLYPVQSTWTLFALPSSGCLSLSPPVLGSTLATSSALGSSRATYRAALSNTRPAHGF